LAETAAPRAVTRAPRVLAPVLAINDRLRTSARLAVLVAVLLLPCAVATWSYTSSVGGQMDFSSRERLGVQTLRPALVALAGTAGGGSPDLAAVEAAVKAHPQLALAEQADAVRTAGAAGTGTPAARVALAQALVDLITQIGNDSNLILDPDLDSYYLMDIQVLQLPKALLAAAESAAPVAAPGTKKLVAEQAVLAGELASAGETIDGDLATAVHNTQVAGLAGRLDSIAAVTKAASAQAATLTGALGSAGHVDPAPLAQAASASAAPLVTELDNLLALRVADLSGKRTRTLTITLVGLVVAVWLAAAVWWRNRHDVRLMVTGMTAIAGGDLGERPLPDGRDELGEIGRALATARGILAEQEAGLRQAQADREEQMHASFVQQRRAERQARERAQRVVDENSHVVIDELSNVMAQVEAVRTAARTIEERVTAADSATRSVISRAQGTDEVVSVLEESLRRVADTALLIAGVAGQTKLLALNATIEAARAGEAGRGFSVVASEVKELASSTATSTEQITSTVSSLKDDAGAMAATITGMAKGIDGVGEANAVLRTVAAEQHTLVEQLEHSARQAIDRMRGMAELTEKLERRNVERANATGPVLVRTAERTYELEMLDLSTGGMRLFVPPEVPLTEQAKVDVTFSLGDQELTVPARVAYRRSEGAAFRVGLSFLAPDPRTLELIERHVVATLEADGLA
jgi:methyl-accepting chemotaxis protein